jgi:hypothetical protein
VVAELGDHGLLHPFCMLCPMTETGGSWPPTRTQLSQMSENELRAELEQAKKDLSCVQGRIVALLGEIGRRETFKLDGCAHLGEWSAGALSMTPSHGRELAKLSTELSRLPALSNSLARGSLGVDQIKPLLHVATPENEAELANQVQGLSPKECRRFAMRIGAASSSIQTQINQQNARFVSLSQQEDGSYRLSGRLSEEAGTQISSALFTLAKDAPPDPLTGEYEPWGARMADALLDLVAAGVQAENPGRPFMVVHVDQSALENASEGYVEIEGGPMGTVSVSKETGRRLACDSFWQSIVESSSGDPVALSKTSRSAPSFLRGLLRRRDGTCRFPGCRNSRFLRAHHILHWADGGKTELNNLVFLCNKHHHFVHEQQWSLEGDPNAELIFVSPEKDVRLPSKIAPRRLQNTG